jgi:uncharacterized protein
MSSEPVVSRYSSHRAKRLTVYLKLRDRANHRPIMLELLKRARKAKLAGMTVFQGEAGYGNSGRLLHPHALIQDAPQSVVAIDRPEQIDAFLKQIDDLTGDVLVVIEDVEVVEI